MDAIVYRVKGFKIILADFFLVVSSRESEDREELDISR